MCLISNPAKRYPFPTHSSAPISLIHSDLSRECRVYKNNLQKVLLLFIFAVTAQINPLCASTEPSTETEISEILTKLKVGAVINILQPLICQYNNGTNTSRGYPFGQLPLNEHTGGLLFVWPCVAQWFLTDLPVLRVKYCLMGKWGGCIGNELKKTDANSSQATNLSHVTEVKSSSKLEFTDPEQFFHTCSTNKYNLNKC